jgi:hypothetical protein
MTVTANRRVGILVSLPNQCMHVYAYNVMVGDDENMWQPAV